MKLTIKMLADLAGVTTRTLRYYDEIGLLAPNHIGDNGYRYYDYGNLLQLQQILLYRELDVPVKQIKNYILQPEFNVLESLEQHRRNLEKDMQRMVKIIDTVDQTIATLKGEWMMSTEDYFEGFDEKKYEQQAKKLWGDTAKYKQSHKRWASYTDNQKEAIKEEGRVLTLRMVTRDALTLPDDPDVQTAVGEYFEYMNKYFYTCDLEFLRALADMWVQDPKFSENYERIREGGATFIRKAVHIYCDNHAQ